MELYKDGLHAVKSVVSIFTATLDQLLSEKAQLQAIKFLGNFIQNNNAGPDEEQVSNGYALVAATQSLTSLVQILGSSAAPALTEQIIKALFGCLNHILPSTRLNAAWCLRTCVLSTPNQMSAIIDQLIKRLNDFRSNRQAIEGHAAAISAIIATSNITSPRGLAPGKVTKILGLCSELLKPVNDTSASLSRVMGAWLLYAGLLSAKYLAKREKNDLRNAIMAQIKSCFPQKDVKGVFIKELTLGQDKLSTLIETRSGALRAIQILSESGDDVIDDVIIKKTVTAVLRSAVEYLKYVNDVATKYPNLKSAIKFYKMRLYRTLTVRLSQLSVVHNMCHYSL